MSISLTRTFHPVGHGAFYTEKIVFVEDGVSRAFNIVYDCGSGRRMTHSAKEGKAAVSNAFADDEKIDYLFISHLDADHINLLGDLRNRFTPESKIVLPCLPFASWLALSANAILRGSGDSLELFVDPKEYIRRAIGAGVMVIAVRPEQVEGDEPNESLYWPVECDDYVNSGHEFELPHGVSCAPVWRYMVRNFHVDQKLLNQLSAKLGTYPRNPQDLISRIREVKEVYGQVLSARFFNRYSMLVYSLPSACQERGWTGRVEQFVQEESPAAQTTVAGPGCVFTGDMELSRYSIWSGLYSQFRTSCIGTIQIPHHGARGNFKIDDFKTPTTHPCHCVISCKGSGVGRVTPTLNGLNAEGHSPVVVSEANGFAENFTRCTF